MGTLRSLASAGGGSVVLVDRRHAPVRTDWRGITIRIAIQ
jgi:hypothetical protein